MQVDQDDEELFARLLGPDWREQLEEAAQQDELDIEMGRYLLDKRQRTTAAKKRARIVTRAKGMR